MTYEEFKNHPEVQKVAQKYGIQTDMEYRELAQQKGIQFSDTTQTEELPETGGTFLGELGKEDVSGKIQRTVSNIPKSAMETGKNTIAPLTDPVGTAKGLWEAVKNPKMVYDYYKDRFSNLGKTMEEDPVGLGMDVSSVLTGGGGALSKLGKVSKMGKLEELGQAVKMTGEVTNPVNVGLNAAKTPAVAASKAGASESLMLKALGKGMSPKLRRVEELKQAEQALKRGIMPTYKGVDQINDLLDKFEVDIDNIIQGRGSLAPPTDSKMLADKVRDLKKDFQYTLETEQKKYYKAIDGVADDIEWKGPDITVESLQGIKKDLHKELKAAYEQSKKIGGSRTRNVKTQAKKQLAADIRQQIENLLPEVKQINPESSALIGLRDTIEEVANKVAKEPLIPIGPGMAGWSVHLATDSRWATIAAMLAKHILEKPSIKARLAIALKRSEKYATTPGTAALIPRTLGQTSNIQETQDDH